MSSLTPYTFEPKLEDVSLSYILPSFVLEVGSFEPQTTDPIKIPIYPHQHYYVFSNLASKTVFDILANGAAKGSHEQEDLLFHSHGKPLVWTNEIFPLLFQFLYETSRAGGPTIDLSRRIWIDPSATLKRDFERVLQGYFYPDIDLLDFSNTESVKAEVNRWIREKTGELIQDALGESSIRADTRLIIAATLSFQGEWFEPFVDADEHEFQYLDGQTGRLPFMTTTGKQYIERAGGKHKRYTMLHVPFKQPEPSRFSMLFYVPDERSHFEQMREFIGNYESVYHDLIFPDEQKEVGTFLIPKFTLRMSSGWPFKSQDNAPYNFPEIVDSPATGVASDLGRVASYLSINEIGVTASAATFFYLHENPPVGKTVPTPIVPKGGREIDFVADKPFIFFIRDNKFGRMLFSGALMNPQGMSPSFQPSTE